MSSALLAAAQAAMRAAAAVGATETATLTRTSSSYDPATGTNTRTTTDYTWVVVVEDYAEGRVNGTSIMAGDRRVIGAASDLSVSPDPETDTLVLSSLTYNIVPGGVRRDPAGATWTLQVRR